MLKFKSTYSYSLVGLSQAELLLSGLKQLIEKQNDENLQLQNRLGIKPVVKTVCYYIFIFSAN